MPSISRLRLDARSYWRTKRAAQYCDDGSGNKNYKENSLDQPTGWRSEKVELESKG